MFRNAAGIPEADSIARWDGTRWSALGSNGAGDGALTPDANSNLIGSAVYTLLVSGADLYVGGSFKDAAGIRAADMVARWDGTAWSALGADSTGNGAIHDFQVKTLAFAGTDLYAGGWFSDAAGIDAADYLARWDGHSWSAVGAGTSGGAALNNWVLAIAVSGDDVYVGGIFEDAAGIPAADKLAKWDGHGWSAVGADASGPGPIEVTGGIEALAVSGADLYVGGYFDDAAGIAAADNVARFDGSRWHALGSSPAGGDGAIASGVTAFAFTTDGLYVGGYFRDAAGIATADGVAVWDGTVWSAVGSNGSGDGAIFGTVWALAADGSTTYVGGYFDDAAGIPAADHVARWDALP
jgi:hypothetical protein